MKTVTRLYDSFLPKHYDISMKIDRKNRSFEGTVVITGHKPHAKKPITLHSKDLTIHSMHANGLLVPTRVGVHDELSLHAELDPGDYEVVVSYGGQITDTMHGLYPSFYDIDGEQHELLVTQFESHHAREVFPCIDEPEAKATFSLELTTEKHVTVLSNMPLQKKSDHARSTIHRFETSPRMSTYLLAFVIGKLHHVSTATPKGTRVAVHGTPSQSNKSMRFALDIAVRGIVFLEDYFGVPYPLTKSDHVAIPDFSAGAMENWGLITYREKALLAEPSAAQSTKEQIATVIAHELSHQWFGNLVTMRWWDDLWLNESFANLMEYIVVDSLHPEWNIWQEFAANEVSTALNRDYLAGVQPVKSPVHHPDEISVLFDAAIVYAKGGRLLKMLRSYIGEDVFKSGLKYYFNTHAYSNTSSADLWRAFSHYTDKDVEGLMSTWLKQSGIPLLTVHTTDEGYRITQRRLVVGSHDDSQKWAIPLSPKQADFPTLLTNRHVSFVANHRFPLINQGGNSHFVTQYDTKAMTLMYEQLQSGRLDTVDRLLLLSEYLLLAKTGTIEFDDVIDLIGYYTNESDQAVWSVIVQCIKELRRFASSTEDIAIWNAFVQHLCLPTAQRLTLGEQDTESEADKKLRAMVHTLLIESAHEETISWLLSLDKTADKSISTVLRPLLYRARAQYGTRDSFADMVALLKSTQDPHLRQDLADALSSTRDEDHIAVLLHSLSDKDAIKPQDIVRWFVWLSSNPQAERQVWEWMKHSWRRITLTFDGDKSYDSFPRYSARYMNTPEEYREYCSFFEPKMSNHALRRTIEIGKRELKHRSELISENRDHVMKALANATRTK